MQMSRKITPDLDEIRGNKGTAICISMKSMSDIGEPWSINCHVINGHLRTGKLALVGQQETCLEPVTTSVVFLRRRRNLK